MKPGLFAEAISIPHTTITSFSMHLAPSRILGLIGPSGSGKTTLARVMSGALPPLAGRVLYDAHPLPPRCTDIALISQQPRAACNPRWTLERIIAEPLRIKRKPGSVSEFAQRALVPLELLNRKPHEVSDGQLQRATIARALAQQPRFLICDEPTASLDAANTQRIAVLLQEIAAGGVGILLISHEHDVVDAVADQVISL